MPPSSSASAAPTKQPQQQPQQLPNIYNSTSSWLLNWIWMGAALYCIVMFAYWAYRIRMGAIDEYGPVIHEFDPYFNYRATEYLYHNGAKKFFTWFDYMVWYPLGRPVGTTIYPGMQFTAVWLKRFVFTNWSLNDVCCYIPAWFGAIASFLVGCIAYECTIPVNTTSNLFRVVMDLINGEQTELKPLIRPLALGFTSPALECGIFAMGMMAIVPAHLMRSVGGGYDNESVATSAMTLTFYFWVRSLRNTETQSYLVYGVLTGLAYFYMVAAWGGYVFVLNLIGVHAATLVLMGRFSDKVYASYSLFYLIGTFLAIQVPVVGWSPLKSLEQLGPCAVFLGYQMIQFCEIIKRRQNLNRIQAWKLRFQVFGAAGLVGLVAVWVLAPTGYFGPISSRVRGLFVQHTKTGNPLVDSVAEHQPASNRAYFQYLHHVCSLAPMGYFMLFTSLSDSSSFLVVWGTAAYFFSHRMVRLILLTGPIGSALGGIAVGRGFAWCVRQLWDAEGYAKIPLTQYAEPEPVHVHNGKAKDGGGRKQQRKGGKKYASHSSTSSFDGLTSLMEAFDTAGKSKEGIFMKRIAAGTLLLVGYLVGVNFINYCWRLSVDLSNPTIIMKARLRDGRIIKVDDYREAYWWLRDNTPEDSRIMAWWDYGYQITAIGNRTTLADGNTWNHEHIALLGKALTSDIEEGYEIARHMADYVLIWGGGGGDDLAKSPHLARIANSVYRDMCPEDPTCRSFGFIDRNGTPSKMMERSLLYRLHGHQLRPGVEADPLKFKEVYRSKYGRVRIFKILGVSEESKQWVADPANRKCDAPGSWFCPGQYPPGLSSILARKRDFAQLEDFNRGSADEDYVKQYFEGLNNPEQAAKKAQLRERDEAQSSDEATTTREEPKKESAEPSRKVAVDEIYNTFEDTEDTTMMWKLITSNQVEDLKQWLEKEPTAAFVRSKDGRGPMWWAFESRNQEIVKLLMMAGVPHTDRDSQGLTPVDLLEGGAMKQ